MRAAAGIAIGLGLACALAACPGGERTGDDAGGGDVAAVAADRKMAPDFALEDMDGKQVRLSALRGKTVVIDFWATWCPPCEFQVPALNAIHDANRDGSVVVLGVSVDTEGREAVAPWLAKHGVRYTILLGNEGVAREFGAPGFPALVVVGADGSIQSMHVGLVEEDELRQVLAEAGTPGRSG